jgi:hypothetical protein
MAQISLSFSGAFCPTSNADRVEALFDFGLQGCGGGFALRQVGVNISVVIQVMGNDVRQAHDRKFLGDFLSALALLDRLDLVAGFDA